MHKLFVLFLRSVTLTRNPCLIYKSRHVALYLVIFHSLIFMYAMMHAYTRVFTYRASLFTNRTLTTRNFIMNIYVLLQFA